ncbi:MAG: glycosyltransferase family 4 protein [Halobacteriota archaeon]
MTLRVLSLVTNDRARFYRQQVRGLRSRGVDCTTVAVPSHPEKSDDVAERRSVADYAKFYPAVIKESFGDYDLLHANFGLTAPPAVLQPNVPVVLSLWGTDLFGPYGRVSRVCARFSEEVVVMSPEMNDALRVGSHVIPHGVDIDRFAPSSQSAARSALGWDPDSYHVLFPYPRSRSVKDYPRAARIVAVVRERLDQPIQLQTVNNVPHDRMPVYMNAADMLLLTSKREGSPNSIKEALACDLPIVSTDVGDVRSNLEGVSPSAVCTNDVELVAAVESILRSVRDPERESEGSRSNGREAAERLSHERMTEALLTVYRSALATA